MLVYAFDHLWTTLEATAVAVMRTFTIVTPATYA
jgi:hypothetical protein